MNMLVGFYLAMEDGTVRVERNHAHCKVLQTAHAGLLLDDGVSLEQFVASKLDGAEAVAEAPSSSTSSSTGSSQVPDLQLTDFAREFLRKWRWKHGARFRVYKQGSRKAGGPEAAQCSSDSRARPVLPASCMECRCWLLSVHFQRLCRMKSLGQI